ncbi:hypothetical protein ACSD7O_18060 [Methylorubrum extorquens]|uniref:hypothetical protein n=1 Tax=Methylorubrum extorquens TaxID=408 RepID=UPI003F622F95
MTVHLASDAEFVFANSLAAKEIEQISLRLGREFPIPFTDCRREPGSQTGPAAISEG